MHTLMKDLPTGLVQCEGYKHCRDSYRSWGYFRINGVSYSGGEGPRCYTPDPPKKFTILDDEWHEPIEVEARYGVDATSLFGTRHPEVYSLYVPGDPAPFFQIYTTAQGGGATEYRELYTKYLRKTLFERFGDLRGDKLKEAFQIARTDPKRSQIYVEERIKQLESFVTSLFRTKY